MSERKAGWYWVKVDGDWECAQYDCGDWHITRANHEWPEDNLDEVGPRIPTPDEADGWQLVPARAPTIDMTEAGMNEVMRGQDYERAQRCWKAMLAAAPKLGGRDD